LRVEQFESLRGIKDIDQKSSSLPRSKLLHEFNEDVVNLTIGDSLGKSLNQVNMLPFDLLFRFKVFPYILLKKNPW